MSVLKTKLLEFGHYKCNSFKMKEERGIPQQDNIEVLSMYYNLLQWIGMHM